jgi:hypothetical protein
MSVTFLSKETVETAAGTQHEGGERGDWDDERAGQEVRHLSCMDTLTLSPFLSFVDRYIPGYVFFGEGVTRGGTVEGRPAWERKGLCITIDQERQVVGTEKF